MALWILPSCISRDKQSISLSGNRFPFSQSCSLRNTFSLHELAPRPREIILCSAALSHSYIHPSCGPAQESWTQHWAVLNIPAKIGKQIRKYIPVSLYIQIQMWKYIKKSLPSLFTCAGTREGAVWAWGWGKDRASSCSGHTKFWWLGLCEQAWASCEKLGVLTMGSFEKMVLFCCLHVL